jgi:hypothetical protein
MYLIALLPLQGLAQFEIIPKPQEVIVGDGQFTLSANYGIDCLSGDSFLRTALYDWVKNTAIKKVKANKMVQTKITVQLVGKKKWHSYLAKMEFTKRFEPGIEGYVVKIDKNSILLLAQTETGLFYGFQTLQQLFCLPQIACGEIYDKPAFAVRAWQDDISRGPIPTLQQLKKEISTLAHYKLNYFTLYTEHVFRYKSHGDIAPLEGISAQEIEELNNYAKLYHVELIANQQSFGHMEKLLEKGNYTFLGEKKHILSPSKPETYQLLNDFYTEQNACYGGKYFMINADETFGLGSEQNKAMADSLGIGNLYAYHINKVYKLIEPSGKKVLMWSDIVANYPEIISQLPKDIIQVPWAYHHAESFENMLAPLAKAGLSFWVAPGVNNWQNIYPNELEAKNNIYKLIRDGEKYGASGVLNTTWDDGGYALFNNNWRGLIWGAELSWHTPKPNETSDNRWYQFNIAYDFQFWGLPLTEQQNALANLHFSKPEKTLRNELFFEPIFPIYPANIGPQAEKSNMDALAELERIYKKTDSIISFGSNQNLAELNLKFAIKEAQFSISKNLFRIHYQNFLDHWVSAPKILEELELLKQKLQNIRDDFKHLYVDENRDYYLQENLAAIDKLMAHLEQIPEHCIIKPSLDISQKGRKIELIAPLSSAPIFYTLGTDSNFVKKSVAYKKPIYLKEDVKITCATKEFNQVNATSKEEFVYHLGIGKIKKISPAYSTYHPSYSGGGAMALVDGRLGSDQNIRSGRWQAFSGNDLIIELDLGKETAIEQVQMGFYQCTPSWVILPRELQVYGSQDGINYTLIGNVSHNIAIEVEAALKHDFKLQVNKQKVSYLRVVAKYAGPLPASHPAKGSASMIFADELIIR